MQSANCKVQNGFTLLEVVVALSIVALGVVTVLQIFSTGLRLGTRSFDRTEATSYGRQVLDEFLLHREVRDGSEEGAYGGRHRWRLQVYPVREEVQQSSTGWELKEVTLELRYWDGAREKQVETKTLRLVKKKGP